MGSTDEKEQMLKKTDDNPVVVVWEPLFMNWMEVRAMWRRCVSQWQHRGVNEDTWRLKDKYITWKAERKKQESKSEDVSHSLSAGEMATWWWPRCGCCWVSHVLPAPLHERSAATPWGAVSSNQNSHGLRQFFRCPKTRQRDCYTQLHTPVQTGFLLLVFFTSYATSVCCCCYGMSLYWCHAQRMQSQTHWMYNPPIHPLEPGASSQILLQQSC